MKYSRMLRKAVAVLMVAAFGFLSLVVAPAQAAMVGTADLLQSDQNNSNRHQVKLFLERQDVAQQLRAWGVNPEEAKARVDSMTDSEISQLCARINHLPAGGDALGIIVAASVLVFVALVITDLAGVTDVFTFIKKR